jgi:hypothetical protein
MEEGQVDADKVVSDYFDAWFAVGTRYRTPLGAIAIYKCAPPDIKAKLEKLPVERQMAILLVPVRGQARYKKSGLAAYIAWKESPDSGARGHTVTKRDKYIERNLDLFINNN